MTNDQNDFDEDPQLRALLAQSDPAHSLTPADPHGLARLLRHIQEATMNDAADTTPVRQRGRLSWLAGAAAVAVIAGGGFAIASSMGGDDPVKPQAADKPTPTQTPTATATADPVVVTLQAPTIGAKCAVPSPAILGQFDTVFSGTVTAIDGDVVTLSPDRGLRRRLGRRGRHRRCPPRRPDPRRPGHLRGRPDLLRVRHGRPGVGLRLQRSDLRRRSRAALRRRLPLTPRLTPRLTLVMT